VRISTFLAGTLLILAGIIIFIENLGFGWRGFSGYIFNYWPVLLIIVGVGVFWGGKIPYWLAFVIVAALAGGVIFFALAGQRPYIFFHI